MTMTQKASFTNNGLDFRVYIDDSDSSLMTVQADGLFNGVDITGYSEPRYIGIWDSAILLSIAGVTDKTVTVEGLTSGSTTLTLTFEQKCKRNGIISRTISQATAVNTTGGSPTARWAINGTNVGSSANTVSTSENIQNHTSNNLYVIDDRITCVVTIPLLSSCTNLAFCMQ